MSTEMMRDILELIESQVQRRQAPIDFEMAYQVRVAIDRIKFAIKHNEQFGPQTDETRDVGLQLLDALERLQAADRNFQQHFRARPPAASRPAEGRPVNGRLQASARH